VTGEISIGRPLDSNGLISDIIGRLLPNGEAAPPTNGYFHRNGWESDGNMMWRDEALRKTNSQNPKLFQEMTKVVSISTLLKN
jgi:hypothetical protein